MKCHLPRRAGGCDGLTTKGAPPGRPALTEDIMFGKRMALALTTSALVALSGAAASEEDRSGANRGKTEAEAGPLAALAMAQELYAWGMANDDALSVLAAARIMASVDVADAERAPTTAPIEGATAAETGEGGDGPPDAAAMFAAARALAGEDAALLAMIDDAEAEGTRGRIGGPSRTLSRLPAGYYDIWEIPFYGGKYAEIWVAGDGDADLDLVVTDENGNVICYDVSTSDNILCSFTPAWDGYFYVRVDNVGRVRNSYYLVTN
jgi:hypothetical protein